MVENLQIMTIYDMLLANGRIYGDMTSNYTCCQYNGGSVVNVFIAQRQLLPLISYFKVLPFDWYSDHAVISVCIAVEVNRIVHMPAGWKTVYNQVQNWNENSKGMFLKKLSDPIISNKLDIFCQTNFPCSNATADQFTKS